MFTVINPVVSGFILASATTMLFVKIVEGDFALLILLSCFYPAKVIGFYFVANLALKKHYEIHRNKDVRTKLAGD